MIEGLISLDFEFLVGIGRLCRRGCDGVIEIEVERCVDGGVLSTPEQRSLMRFIRKYYRIRSRVAWE